MADTQDIKIDKLTIGSTLSAQDMKAMDILLNGKSLSSVLSKLPETWVKSVNGKEPDSTGNISVDVGSKIELDDAILSTENAVKNRAIYDQFAKQGGFKSFTDGSESLPYLIYDKYDLEYLRVAIENGFDTTNKHFKQMYDIDMTGLAFEGIGTNQKFKGTYNGNNKSIKNLKFKLGDYRALFRNVTAATIKNINVQVDGFDYSEYTINKDYGTLNELKAAKPTGEENVIYWLSNGQTDNGKKIYWVWDGSNYAEFSVGGCAIVGQTTGNTTIENVVAEGTLGTEELPCSHNVAGIAIKCSSGTVTIRNVVSNVNLVNSYTKAGGILAFCDAPAGSAVIDGATNNGNIKNIMFGEVSDAGGTGGIYGWHSTSGAGTISIKNVTNTGSIESSLKMVVYSGEQKYVCVGDIAGAILQDNLENATCRRGYQSMPRGKYIVGEIIDENTIKLVDRTNVEVGKDYVVASMYQRLGDHIQPIVIKTNGTITLDEKLLREQTPSIEADVQSGVGSQVTGVKVEGTDHTYRYTV